MEADEKLAAGLVSLQVEDAPQSNILFITSDSMLHRETTRVSLNTTVHFESINSYNIRNIRGRRYSAVFLIGISERELYRSFLDLYQAVERACVSSMTKFMEL